MITEDGLLQLAGRIKDIIIRSGENISPQEIEKVMMEEDTIREVLHILTSFLKPSTSWTYHRGKVSLSPWVTSRPFGPTESR